MSPGEIVFLALAGWFAIGTLIGIAFLAFGVTRIDHAAKGASLFFRPMIFLGCVLIWPLVLIRWLSGITINEEEDAQ